MQESYFNATCFNAFCSDLACADVVFDQYFGSFKTEYNLKKDVYRELIAYLFYGSPNSVMSLCVNNGVDCRLIYEQYSIIMQQINDIQCQVIKNGAEILDSFQDPNSNLQQVSSGVHQLVDDLKEMQIRSIG